MEVDAEEQNEEEEGTLSGEIPDGDLEEETSEVNENEGNLFILVSYIYI